ncbi:MAG: hypothetical protein LW629_05030 [Burkholderiales bacterium]|jgi:hypothetical protein|nr:hypothetical protein [Burkholderiales bacterium]
MNALSFSRRVLNPAAGVNASPLDVVNQALRTNACLSSNEDASTLLTTYKQREFRFVCPVGSRTVLMVADIFSGSDEEIRLISPTLLYANFQSQILGLKSDALSQQAPTLAEALLKPLPILGLMPERKMIVMSLMLTEQNLAQQDFAELVASLFSTIHADAQALSDQLNAGR